MLAFSQSIMSPAATGLVSVFAAANEQGTVLGVAQSLGALGRFSGPELIGVVYDSGKPDGRVSRGGGGDAGGVGRVVGRTGRRKAPAPPSRLHPSRRIFSVPRAGVSARMRVYKTGEIRNVAVVGHGASGKTSLVDALAFVAGTSKRHGSVKDGTALTDYTPDEIERKYSINLALAVAEWMDTKINLIDTPGLSRFHRRRAGRRLRRRTPAVVVVSATAGVEVGTEKVWDYCEQRGLPRMFFVSLMDKEHADFERVYEQIKERLTPKVIPVEIPVGEGPEFHGIINLFSEEVPPVQEGHQGGRVRRGGRAGRVPGAVRRSTPRS